MLYFLVVVSFIAIQVVAAETFYEAVEYYREQDPVFVMVTRPSWNDMMVVFGGRDRRNVWLINVVKNDVWSLNLTSLEWTCSCAATTITYTKQNTGKCLFYISSIGSAIVRQQV